MTPTGSRIPWALVVVWVVMILIGWSVLWFAYRMTEGFGSPWG